VRIPVWADLPAQQLPCFAKQACLFKTSALVALGQAKGQPSCLAAVCGSGLGPGEREGGGGRESARAGSLSVLLAPHKTGGDDQSKSNKGWDPGSSSSSSSCSSSSAMNNSGKSWSGNSTLPTDPLVDCLLHQVR
jgi:hypothetical protein